MFVFRWFLRFINLLLTRLFIIWRPFFLVLIILLLLIKLLRFVQVAIIIWLFIMLRWSLFLVILIITIILKLIFIVLRFIQIIMFLIVRWFFLLILIIIIIFERCFIIEGKVAFVLTLIQILRIILVHNSVCVVVIS